MWSWWGPAWTSVRCRGKSEWRSSPVGTAQTQRRAQMKPPASATPKHPCQVKTTPSDPQTGRQAGWELACQMLCTASHIKATFHSAFVIWSSQKCCGFRPCHLVGLFPIYPPASRPERTINCHATSWCFRAACLCLFSLQPLGEVVIWRQLFGCMDITFCRAASVMTLFFLAAAFIRCICLDVKHLMKLEHENPFYIQ